jgi:ATP synthase protein I
VKGRQDPPPEWSKAWRAFARFGTIGIEMGVSVAIGVGVGLWLDGRFHTEPLFLIVFLLFGVVAGFRALYRTARAAQRDAQDQRNQRDETDDA